MERHLRPPTRPLADPSNVIIGDRYRITVLDAGLLRVEYSDDGVFEDRASQTVWFRDLPPASFDLVEGPDLLQVHTHRLHLRYDKRRFTTRGLSVQTTGAALSYHRTWRYGLPYVNFGGTARTLDEADGAVPLEDGVLSRHGIATIDDSATALIEPDGSFAERRPGNADLYLFGYGRDYKAALKAFYAITGPQPLLPRYALGNWWSRYHAYSAQEYLALMDRFSLEGVPFSVAVLDMDWHVSAVDPKFGSGWTGYTWNRDLFPDPEAFLRALRARNLRVTLNTHPADGIRAFEDAYPAVAARLGIDPDSGLPAVFDPTDPAFLSAYLEEVHHPLEAQGVDFWWLDWQQGTTSSVPGLDPLWLLNHMHYLDAGRPRATNPPATAAPEPGDAPAAPGDAPAASGDAPRAGAPPPRRALTFSRYAGLGSHRYPVGFSGDSVISWESLDFQPHFTATASNAGYGWWSHDIGGHMYGVKDEELATRWVQFGVFSPIMRLHSTRSPFNSKEPWRYGPVAEKVMTHWLRLRHRLVPYLATMNVRAHTQGEPLIQPMYYDHPWEQIAYEVRNQYRFGSELLVAAITTPGDRGTGLGRVGTWLPEGVWFDVFTGLAYRGGRPVTMHRNLESIPVLMRAGSVLPLAGDGQDLLPNGVALPTTLHLKVFGGADGHFTLVEDADDGGDWARTRFEFSSFAGTLRICPVEGAVEAVPLRRDYVIDLIGFARVSRVELLNERELASEVPTPEPGHTPGSLRVRVPAVDARRGARLRIVGDGSTRGDNQVRQRLFQLLDAGQIRFEDKERVWSVVNRVRDPHDAALAVHALDLSESLLGAVVEILLAR